MTTRTALRLSLASEVRPGIVITPGSSSASGEGPVPAEPLQTFFLDDGIPQSEIPPVDYREAEPWLTLSRLYSQVDRPYLAYRMARAARNVEPGNPETYRRIGETISSLNVAGGRDLAIKAYKKYFALAGENREVRKVLDRL